MHNFCVHSTQAATRQVLVVQEAAVVQVQDPVAVVAAEVLVLAAAVLAVQAVLIMPKKVSSSEYKV